MNSPDKQEPIMSEPELELNDRMFADLEKWQAKTGDHTEKSRSVFLDAWEAGRRYGEERIAAKIADEPTQTTSSSSPSDSP